MFGNYFPLVNICKMKIVSIQVVFSVFYINNIHPYSNYIYGIFPFAFVVLIPPPAVVVNYFCWFHLIFFIIFSTFCFIYKIYFFLCLDVLVFSIFISYILFVYPTVWFSLLAMRKKTNIATSSTNINYNHNNTDNHGINTPF